MQRTPCLLLKFTSPDRSRRFIEPYPGIPGTWTCGSEVNYPRAYFQEGTLELKGVWCFDELKAIEPKYYAEQCTEIINYLEVAED